MFFRGVCSEAGQDPQGQKAPKCLKTLVFSGMLCLSGVVSSVASRGEESEKHHLENTVWNPWAIASGFRRKRPFAMNYKFHGITPGFSGDLSIGNDPKNTHTHKFLTPAQSQDNPPNLFMFMCLSFPETKRSQAFNSVVAVEVPTKGWTFQNPSVLKSQVANRQHGHACRFSLSKILRLCLKSRVQNFEEVPVKELLGG